MSATIHVDAAVRRVAVAWFVRLNSGTATEQDHRACAEWRHQDSQHEQAWLRLQNVQKTLGSVPGDIATPTLKGIAHGRRTVLKGLVCVAVSGTGAWLAYRERLWQPYLADERTAIGERRRVVLDDGSTLHINTNSAVDVEFDSRARRVHLHRGEILLVSAHPAGEQRPLLVESRHGVMRALGTRFSVRLHETHTRIAVLEHAVEIRPRDAAGMRLDADHATSFDERGVQSIHEAAAGSDAWTRGHLMVSDRSLEEVIAELARYRSDKLHCAPAVAGIRVSGVLPVDDTDRALAILAGRFPIVIGARADGVVVVDARR